MEKISVSGPDQLLAVLPYQLGFRPRSSVVIACFRGRRMELVARLDAVPAPSAAVAAAEVLPPVLQEAPDWVVLVGYEEDAGECLPLSEALAAALRWEGVEIGQRVAVRAGRWFCLSCDDCPADGTPLLRDADVPGLAGYVGLGRSVLPGRDALGDLVRPMSPRDARAAELGEQVEAWERRFARAHAAYRDWQTARWDHAFHDELLDGDGDSDGDSDGDGDVDDSDDSGDSRDSGDSGDSDDSGDFDDFDDSGDFDDEDVVLEHMADGAYPGGPARPTDLQRLRGEALQAWRLLLDGRLDCLLSLPSGGPLVLEGGRELVPGGGDTSAGGHSPDVDAAHLAVLVGSLRHHGLRDALIAWLCPGTLGMEVLDPDVARALEEHLGPPRRSPAPKADGQTSGAGGDPLAGWSADAWPELVAARLAALVRQVPGEHATPVLAVVACHAWWRGDGARAAVALEQAAQLEPDHRLCHLLRQMVSQCIRPTARPA